MPPTDTVGIRNNNYLNVKNGADRWADAGGKSQTDPKGHAVFTDPAYGVRAGILLLRAYYFKHGLRTIAQILSRWAPASDTIGSQPDMPQNSPLDYSTFVAERMGISYNRELDIFRADKSVGNIARLRGLFSAMAAYENGADFEVPADDFYAGLELVQPGITAEGESSATRGGATTPTMWEIGGSVGRRDKGAANAEADVETVQEMLRLASMLLHDPRLDPGIIDGKIGADAATSATLRAIEAFQGRFLTRPDGVISVGGRTWRELVNALDGEGAVIPNPADPTGTSTCYFPFTQLPKSGDWKSGQQSYGSRRGKGKRAHAACDLYFPQGTVIHAITDGKVVRGPYYFYDGTYALEVDHGDFIARYGEIQQKTFVREGDTVRAGQQIARVGHLTTAGVASDMLHLELYDKSKSGSLTVMSNATKRTSDGRPFYRRQDLMDPTAKLNEWKSNLPGLFVVEVEPS